MRDPFVKWLGRGEAALALELGADAIALHRRRPGDRSGAARGADSGRDHNNWEEVGRAAPGAPDFVAGIDALREAAFRLAGGPAPFVDVWLPAERILTVSAETPAAARAALAARAPIPVAELAVAAAPGSDAGRGATLSAAERAVVREAQVYIRRWGFSPGRVAARPSPRFPTGPTFATAPVSRRAIGVAAAAFAAAAGLAAFAILAPAGGPLARDGDAPPAVSVAAPEPGAAPARLRAAPAPQPPSSPSPGQERPARPGTSLALLATSAGGPGAKPIIPGAPASPPPTGAAPAVRRDAPGEDIAPSERAGLDGPGARRPAAVRAQVIGPPASPEIRDPAPAGGEAPPPGRARARIGAGPVLTPDPPAARPPPDAAAARDPAIDAADPRRGRAAPELAETQRSESAAIAAPAPIARPDHLDMTPSDRIARVSPTPAPRPPTIGPGGARVVSAPARAGPTGPGAARAATLGDAIRLEDMNLLGVFLGEDGRRALVRTPGGEVVRVVSGTVVEGWLVARIEATSLRMTRGGEARVLELPR